LGKKTISLSLLRKGDTVCVEEEGLGRSSEGRPEPEKNSGTPMLEGDT